MKKIIYFVAALATTSFITTMGTSCKFAPDQHDGDTVAASEFYPEDTAAIHAKKTAKMAAMKAIKDRKKVSAPRHWIAPRSVWNASTEWC